MHFNPLLTTSILALTASTAAWNNPDSYDIYGRDVEGLYARDYMYDEEDLYIRNAEPEFLEWDIDSLHPRDAYELGMEAATQYLATRDAYPYASAPAKPAAPAKAAAPAKMGTPAKAAAPAPARGFSGGAGLAAAKSALIATASKQKAQLLKDEKALSATMGKEKKMGIKA